MGTLSAGQTVYDGRIVIDTAWNGTTPQVTLKFGADFIAYGWDATKAKTVGASVVQSGGQQTGLLTGTIATTLIVFNAMTQNQYLPADVTADCNIVVLVDDGGAGPTGATQGSARLYLTVGPTPT